MTVAVSNDYVVFQWKRVDYAAYKYFSVIKGVVDLLTRFQTRAFGLVLSLTDLVP